MDAKLRRDINNIADMIRDVFKITVPISDMNDVVNKLNGDIRYRNDFKDTYDDGRIFRDGESFTIEVPIIDESNERRVRFSIAHEIGHLFLHMGYLVDNELWDNNKDKVYFRKDIGEKEYQAHEFAAAFLMPREEFINVMNDNYSNAGYDMEAVADYFIVSVDAAINRGKWLRLLSWG